MTNWLPDITERKGAKYLRIADAIDDAIQEGELKADTKLPPMRNLAYDLGVTLGTVSRAYQEAERRGLVGGEVGRGTYIKGNGRYPQPQTPRAFAYGGSRENGINLSMAVPPLGDGGTYLAETIREISKDTSLCGELMDYQAHSGLERHRQGGVDWVARTGVETNTDCLTLTNGTQHAILVAAMAIARPGDTLLVESITYPGIIHIASQLGLKLAPVEIDDEGVCPDALEKAILEHRPRCAYMVPTVQNPTTAVMSDQRRRDIANVIMRHNLLVIEDDIWGFLPTDRAASLAAYAPDQVIHVTGLSKAMSPGLRIGYIATPPGATDAIRSVARMSTWMTPPLMAEVATRWLADGTGDEMIRWQRAEAEARMEIAVDALGEFSIRGHKHSYQIWLELPDPWRAEAVRDQAARRGIYFLSGDSFVFGRQQAPHAIRLCVGSCRTRDEVRQGVETVRDILRGPVAGTPVIA
ncbi:PLP-dependent aminotransferase family protein [Thalassospiraceae bacterium LMO-JJ14]|nr:PLP-dependent aminotransferase family protein [Thalassospiraceae bacterium LMO-JJ14]